MDVAQTRTNQNSEQIKKPEFVLKELLSQQQDQWITYCALGGMITEAGFEYKHNPKLGKDVPETLTKMSVTEFAKAIGIPRRTLYEWQKRIPDFAMKVRARREEVFPIARETAAYNRLYLIGMSGNNQAAVDALKTVLGHFSKLRLPTQQHEVEAGQSLLDLVNSARKKNIVDVDEEGNVVEPNPDAGSSA